MLNFNVCGCVCVCVCVGGGGGGGQGAIFMCVFFMLFFFEFRAKHQIIFLTNNQNLEEYFHRQNFNANIFQVAY